MQQKARLVVFEGPDGSGKTTLSSICAATLQRTGRTVHHSSLPGRTAGTLGELVYQIHHDPGAYGLNKISQNSLQLLHVASHLEELETVILPALSEGTTVVLDRFWWSTWAYGLSGAIERPLLERMVNIETPIWETLNPIIFLVHRADRTGSTPWGHDKPELVQAYQELAANPRPSESVIILDNNASLHKTVEVLNTHLLNLC